MSIENKLKALTLKWATEKTYTWERFQEDVIAVGKYADGEIERLRLRPGMMP